MTISSLITELQKLQALHGDLPVVYKNWDDFCSDPVPVLCTEVDHRDWNYTIENNEEVSVPRIHLS